MTLADRIHEVRASIADVCNRVGRAPDSVTLIGVSKTFSVETIRLAASHGLADFGENRVQELVAKADVLHDSHPNLTWHMIGHLQRNKARDVARWAAFFHALDSARLARELQKWCERLDRSLPCLVQVNTSGEASKEGVAPENVLALVESIRAFPRLEVRGLMTIAAPVDDPEEVRHEFRALREMLELLHREHRDLRLDMLSMGMSDDFQVAIEEGATHVRVGRRLFGDRSQPGADR